jgi:DNA phosphorothioation-associated putative methyltransferase
MTGVGKQVVDDLYVHISAIDRLEAAVQDRITAARATLGNSLPFTPNVVKLNLRTGRLSLLAYLDFDEEPFPELAASWSFSAAAAHPVLRTYDTSANPPILHRKELLVPPHYPGREKWVELTAAAESLGLFDQTSTIGFRLNWLRLIESRGYRMCGGMLQPLGNETAPELESTLGDGVRRHLTALTRVGLSAPVQLLLRHGLLTAGATFFDYGCGRGNDLEALAAEGYEASGWDPYYAPDRRQVAADVVNLGFVINVIEDPAERVEAVHKAFALARRVLAVAVMLNDNGNGGLPYSDGVLTSRQTFQKYFSQAELKDYLEHVLHREAVMVGPGVAFVFADSDWEQRFLANRYRNRGVVERLLRARPPRPVRVPRPVPEPKVGRAPRTPKPPVERHPTKAETALAKARPMLDLLWRTCLELGRLPEAEEVPELDFIDSGLGSMSKALRLLLSLYDQDLLTEAARARTDDVCLYLAMRQFSGRPAYRQLEPRLQRDVKAFFGDFCAAQVAGLRLLTSAAESTTILQACKQAAEQGLGWLDGEHSLQLHVSLVERLPTVLRAYVDCGLLLWDALSEVQLVKIHIGSGKLTLLEYDDFDTSPLPTLRRRIKTNIRRQQCDVFAYGSCDYPKPLLYWKSRYLHEDYPGYAEQLAFDEALEATGVLDEDRTPDPQELERLLESRRLCMKGMTLAPSERLPALDDRCGANFTYRQLIECGETQQRLGLANIPLRPESYNALHELATRLLDPVVDYFGSIRLTYGFCSPALSRHITRRVAPKLDQHAACELGRNGNPICERGGAACDFIVDDEDMHEVARWIAQQLPFDRIYLYGKDRPLHVSVSPQPARVVYEMRQTARGVLVPRFLPEFTPQ